MHLAGLTWLHVFEGPETAVPVLGRETALLTHTADLRKSPDKDRCHENCPYRGGPRHHHFVVNIGQGFLGVLEQFAEDANASVRSYFLPLPARRTAKCRLSKKWARRGDSSRCTCRQS